jgi:phosphoribosylformimino-5-aminoimidazole carboxamide ribotide isomerase
MLAGPDLEAARRAAVAVRGSLIYSGGVSTVDDLRALRELRQVNLAGVIVGKALYEQRFTVAEAQAALDI